VKKAEIEARLADYLEGDLPLEDRALFDAYLDAHADSARDVEELRQTIELLRSLPDPEPPIDLGRRVMDRVRAGDARRPWLERLAEAISARLSPQWAVPLTAAAALVVLAVVSGDLRIGPIGAEPASRPAAEHSDLASGGAVAPPVDRPGVPSPTPPTELAAARAARAPTAAVESEVRAEVTGRRLAEIEREARGSAGIPGRLLRTPTTRPPLVAVSNPVAPEPQAGPFGFGDLGVPRQAAGPVMLANPTGLMTAGTFEEPLSPAETEARRNAQLDPMLEALYGQPDELAHFLASRRDGELENWGKELARRAAERGEAERASAAIAANPALDVGPFVQAFESQIDLLRTDIVAREAEANAPTAAESGGR
jgi:hypothetical protein